MRSRLLGTAIVAVVTLAAPLLAQIAAPNAAGVSMGALHYRVKDVGAHVRFWTAVGGRPEAGDSTTRVVALADVFVILSPGESSGGSDGSVVNHVAFRVPSFSEVEARGLKVQRLDRFPGVGYVTSPEGERIELFEDAATNLTFTPDSGALDALTGRHSRPVGKPVAFHHIHLYVPEGKVAEAKAWYAQMFGGTPGKRSTYDAVDLPGVNLNISVAPKPTMPTKGRMLEAIGLEVKGLEAFCSRLRSMGVTFESPCVRLQGDGIMPVSGRITDPWGTTIVLSDNTWARR